MIMIPIIDITKPNNILNDIFSFKNNIDNIIVING